jgi:Domain of unknown function (DUF932)
MSHLASRFGANRHILQASSPLNDEQIRKVAPSIFATDKHGSRSGRYTCIPTIDVLNGLRREGFEPFMVAQTRVRKDDRREYTKHMLRLRHANQIRNAEAQEIVLLNAHDGTSCYQMLAGLFCYACANGLVFGETTNDIRVPHKGDVVQRVVEGAHLVLDGFTRVIEERDAMQAITLNVDEQQVFARAALALRYDTHIALTAPPVTETQLLEPRRHEDRGNDLWRTFNRLQENLIRGGLDGRATTGRRARTRAVQGIDQNVKLNRALWVLATEMRKLRS